ncbi:CPBP family intramembrane glutamic endopeptidase [Cellulomonas cellasea]|uniref:Membrane protease YdiL (CAAX protease family) n=1 Tax=Cellulomonas cellasea TaxID=43670 RepID=A0A7W4Y9N8_9CELL|nr:type II CAAX endopeptidase family protein [Cellulomonas cellasea]MBB2921174.1 membrane protease YdiL (CAAX protease family) [Cellulomonas cellasea]
MTPLDTLQALDAPAVTVAVLAAVALALVVSEPVLGRREHRAFLGELARDTAPVAQESVRVRLYRRWARQAWAYAVGAVLLVVALPGVGLADLGLAAPDLDELRGSDAGSLSGSTLAGFLVGATLAAVASLLLVRFVARRSDRTPVAGAAAIEPMLPRTPRGRRGWSGLALAAGVTEEVTFRGLLILAIALVAPGADRTTVLVAAAVLFGIAHWYQGPVGMLMTGVVGFVLGGLYLSTGSLLVPMVLHTLVDLRVLLLPVPRSSAAPGAEPAVDTAAPGTTPGTPAPGSDRPARPHDAPVAS